MSQELWITNNLSNQAHHNQLVKGDNSIKYDEENHAHLYIYTPLYLLLVTPQLFLALDCILPILTSHNRYTCIYTMFKILLFSTCICWNCRLSKNKNFFLFFRSGTTFENYFGPWNAYLWFDDKLIMIPTETSFNFCETNRQAQDEQ